MPSANKVVVEIPPPSNRAVVVPMVVVVVGVTVVGRRLEARSREVVELPPKSRAVVMPRVGAVGVTVGAVKVAKAVAGRVTVTVGAGATVVVVGKSPREANNNDEEDTPGVPAAVRTAAVRKGVGP